MATSVSRMIMKHLQTTLVFGLGQTGLSCVRFLIQHGHDVIAFDTRQNPPCLEQIYREFPQVEVILGNFEEEILDRVNMIVASPGVSLKTPVLQLASSLNIEILGDVELFVQQVKAPVIAITGSNGKSTTTTLVYEMFKAAGANVRVGGNIGVPVLDLLAEEAADYYVLELSSFQLETTRSLKAEVAVVLNISDDHMDRYSNLDEYARSKLIIYQGAKTRIINADDKWLIDHQAEIDPDSSFTLGEPQAGQYGLLRENGEEWLVCGQDKIMPTSQVQLKGLHQIQNVLAALAITDACGLTREKVIEAISAFTGLAHRTQFVAEIDGVSYVNDSKGTNVGATIAAINGFNENIILIAGGEGKGADFTLLQDAVKNKVSHAILIGRDAGIIEQAIGHLVKVIRAVSLEAAVSQAANVSHPGDVVLFSPACASFDMFKNYQHRGEMFVKAVKEMIDAGH